MAPVAPVTLTCDVPGCMERILCASELTAPLSAIVLGWHQWVSGRWTCPACIEMQTAAALGDEPVPDVVVEVADGR
jgi:hypothetical protein